MKGRFASVIFVVFALFLVSVAICAPASPAQPWDEVVLHSFSETDGARPVAGVIQANDGNFYGVTTWGGANGKYTGTVFKLTPSGTLTTLYSFCSVAACDDGAEPMGGLIQGIDGNFYGTTSQGGPNQDMAGAPLGTVFKITSSGSLTNLYSFTGVGDGASPSASLIQGSDGNFYGTTQFGGAHDEGNVFQLTPSGTLTTLYSFCGTYYCEDGQWPIAGVIQGTNGNLYGTTYYGGLNIFGSVFQLTPSGTLTTLHSFCSEEDCIDGGAPVAGVIQGSDGNFYGTTSGGGANDEGTVFRLTPSGTLTTLYSFCSVFDRKTGFCRDGASPDGGVIQGIDGNFYGTTYANGFTPSAAPIGGGTVFRLTPSGTLTTLYSFTGGTDAANPFAGVIQGSDGNFYGTTENGGANGDGTVFEVGASIPKGHLKVIPAKLILKAEPNAIASASITIENTGTGPVTVNISEPKHSPPFSESGGGTPTIGPGEECELTIVYSPTSSTTSNEKSDSIKVEAISNDPKQRKPIDVKLKGED